jgi:hypothetical protein
VLATHRSNREGTRAGVEAHPLGDRRARAARQVGDGEQVVDQVIAGKGVFLQGREPACCEDSDA